MQYLSRPAVQKFLFLSLYAILGAAAQTGLLPESVVVFLRDNVAPAVVLAFGLGHILPEAGKK